MRWINLLNYLSNGIDNEDLVAYPQVTHKQLVLASLKLSDKLKSKRIKTAAVYFHDNVLFACSLLACANANINIIIIANITAENRNWLTDNCDILLSDENLTTEFSHTLYIRELDCVFTITPDTDLNMNNIRLTLQTSGSNSSQSTTVEKNLLHMYYEACAVKQILPPQATSSNTHILSSVVPQHLYGLSFNIILALCAKWIIYPQRCIYPEEIFRLSQQLTGVVLVSSPAMLHRLAQNLSLSSLNKKNISCIFSAGGFLQADTADLIRNKLAIPLINIYGSTETGVMAFNLREQLWDWLSPVEHKINNKNNSLTIVSPWSNGEKTIFDTIAYAGNKFRLLGRSDRILKLEDKRVNLYYIEQKLLQHPWINDVYVNKHPNYTHLLAWVALNKEGISNLKQHGRNFVTSKLRQFIEPYFEQIAIPRYWRYSEQLTRTPQSKITHNTFIDIANDKLTIPSWEYHEKSAEKTTFYAKIPLDLIYFRWHFNSFPLVPGVVQIKWALQVALDNKLIDTTKIQQIENLKFQHFLQPNDEIYLDLVWHKDNRKLYFNYYFETTKYSSGRILLK